MSLQGQPSRTDYPRLLTIAVPPINTSAKRVQDGSGNNSGLLLKQDAISVDRLEFNTTPVTATVGTVQVLVNESNQARQTTIYQFGQSTKDPYNGFWEFSGTTTVTATPATGVVVENIGNVQVTAYAPTDLSLTDVYDIATNVYMEDRDIGDAFYITVEMSAVTASGWTSSTDFLEIGINTSGGANPEKFIQRYSLRSGDTSKITYSLGYYVTSDIRTNGFTICALANGDSVDISNVSTFLERTIKR
jgi:hypothetical protein